MRCSSDSSNSSTIGAARMGCSAVSTSFNFFGSQAVSLSSSHGSLCILSLNTNVTTSPEGITILPQYVGSPWLPSHSSISYPCFLRRVWERMLSLLVVTAIDGPSGWNRCVPALEGAPMLISTSSAVAVSPVMPSDFNLLPSRFRTYLSWTTMCP
eukprot:2970518-Rhodomonas_salina.2